MREISKRGGSMDSSHSVRMIGSSIGVLGAGNIASAIVAGIISSGIAPAERVVVYDISEERIALFRQKGCTGAASAAEVVEKCDTVILSVKPQNFSDLFGSMRGSLTADKLLITIAAGVTIARVKTLAGLELPVVRVLPNTPMLLSQGASVIAAEAPVTGEQLDFAESIFNSCGITKRIDESAINASLPIHSSSPAFLFLFAKITADYAEKEGIDRDSAMSLFAQTMRGCADMLDKSGMSAEQLIRMVTSPNGTTEAALKEFERLGFSETVTSALVRCKERGDELGRNS